jgi:hypothetical protein
VRSKALAGLQVGDLLAVSPGNVWVEGGGPFLLHLKGTAWTRVKIPGPVAAGSLAADGGGGIWMTNLAISALAGSSVAHLSRTEKWRLYPVSRSGLIYGLGHIPGTASMWGAGNLGTGTGVDAAIWAYGPVG